MHSWWCCWLRIDCKGDRRALQRATTPSPGSSHKQGSGKAGQTHVRELIVDFFGHSGYPELALLVCWGGKGHHSLWCMFHAVAFLLWETGRFREISRSCGCCQRSLETCCPCESRSVPGHRCWSGLGCWCGRRNSGGSSKMLSKQRVCWPSCTYGEANIQFWLICHKTVPVLYIVLF